jgi:hypothetical protein
MPKTARMFDDQLHGVHERLSRRLKVGDENRTNKDRNALALSLCHVSSPNYGRFVMLSIPT